MPRRRPHHHPCQSCGKAVECEGEQEVNFDGWPPVICVVYHRPGGILNPYLRCEDCLNAKDDR